MKTTDEELSTYNSSIDPVDDGDTDGVYSDQSGPSTEDVLDDDDDLHEVQAGDDLDEPSVEDEDLTGDDTVDTDTDLVDDDDDLTGTTDADTSLTGAGAGEPYETSEDDDE
jgi:hypothetical protein